MQNEKTPASKELQDADTALRRAAQTAKKLAEQNGTPYVIAETKSKHALLKVSSENEQ